MKALSRLLFGCLALSALTSCGTDSGPPTNKIAAAVQKQISANWGFNLKQSEALLVKEIGGNFYRINYKGVIVLKEPQYQTVTDVQLLFAKRGVPYPAALDPAEYSDESDSETLREEAAKAESEAANKEVESIPLFFRKTADAGETFEVIGRCMAEKKLDEWDIRCTKFDNISGDGDSRGGLLPDIKKRSTKKTMDVTSAAADAYFADLTAKRDERRKAFAARFKASRDERVRTESQYMPYVSNNQVYEGTLTYWERHLYAAGIVQSGTLPIRIGFSTEGKTVKARIVNISLPDEGVDREERREMESFVPIKGQQYPVDTTQFPLIMKTARGWTRHKVPGRKPLKIPRFFSEPDPLITGYGFKFQGNTLSGSLRNDDTDYKIAATRVGG